MAKYAILENGIVKNIVVADAETAKANGWVKAVGKYATIYQEEIAPIEKTQTELLIETLLEKGLLKESDASKIKEAIK